MKNSLTLRYASRLMQHPSIPAHETLVRHELESILSEENIPSARDRFGNVIATLNTAPRRRPVVLAAHMDHPGFEILRPEAPGLWLARFRGGVPKACFRAGTSVRLCPGGGRAVLLSQYRQRRNHYVLKATSKCPQAPAFAVWDLEPFALEENTIRGRACDDLVGVAAALGAMVALKRSGAKAHVVGAFSRAEEVGFHGALLIAQNRSIPEDALVISLETSREVPGVQAGAGVIIRTGDRASVFDSAATRYLVEVASRIQRNDKSFQFQRALMGGGTCEATAYQEHGYQCAAVCVALGNYHNCSPEKTIEPEFVNATDAVQMSELVGAAAIDMPRFGALTGRLPERLRRLAREAARELAGP